VEEYAMSQPSALCSEITQPKKIGMVGYLPGAEDRSVRRLSQLGIDVRDYQIDVARYREYVAAARYREDFPHYYPFNLPEKSLEHYIAATLLEVNQHDVYIDIASQHSAVPYIYCRLFGAKTYRQDLAYPLGLNGDTIGGDASSMPVPDGFASKMALHCSFEHFEGDTDIGFIREVSRVLVPGGAVCIVPLYIAEEYCIQTDPVVAVASAVVFEDDATIYCADGWNNRYGRFYDPEHLVSRVRGNLNDLELEVYRITNASAADESCYARFAMVLRKPGTLSHDRQAESGDGRGDLGVDRDALWGRLAALRQQLEAAEEDRGARLAVIEAQGQRLGELGAERDGLRAELADLRRQFEAAEVDRAARLEVIEAQGDQIGRLQAQLGDARHVLRCIQAGRVYRLLRRLGRWNWVDLKLSEPSMEAESPALVDATGSATAQPIRSEYLARLIAEHYRHDPKLFSLWESHGFHVTPVHFYSPIPQVSALPETTWSRRSELVGMELNEDAQLIFLDRISRKFKHEYDDFARDQTDRPHQYHLNQMMFRSVDAEILYCMIRHHRPRRIIEVGSGFSTYVSAAAVVKNAAEGHTAELVAIEPYPNEVLCHGFPGLTELLVKPVQSIELDVFARLGQNDILFIDSSHVVRVDSDVRFLILEVLPRLRPGVLIHVHDIFLPYEYPREWVVDEYRFWTEQYLLQAFLACNRDFEIIWAGSYMHGRHREALMRAFSSYDPSTVWPGSFWIRRRQA
jgi:predicted O-methyltransferase YrrM